MNVIECTSTIRHALELYGDGFSLDMRYKDTDKRPEIEHGQATGMCLTPGYFRLKLSFYAQGSGLRVTTEIEETTCERIVETAVALVEHHLKPRAA